MITMIKATTRIVGPVKKGLNWKNVIKGIIGNSGNYLFNFKNFG